MFKILRLLQWITVGLTAVVAFHFEMEDADANEWRAISELPTPRGGFATAVVDGKIYALC